jgi:hypothetical protein
MKHGTHWSLADLATARLMYDRGAQYEDIAEVIGRSAVAVYDMLRKRFGATRVPEYFLGDPIGLTMECERYRRDCKLGSQILREACMDMFCRTANASGISLDEAISGHLGRHERPIIPGTERVRKTAEISRRVSSVFDLSKAA